jgi:RepB DNA-primase from phage plasmid
VFTAGSGAVAESDTTTGEVEARQMLDICASVDARAVDLTLTNSDGEKESFRRNVSLAELGRALPAMLADATAKERNVIIRPHSPSVVFLQLDDLDHAKLARVDGAAFLTIQTSPGNHQAWLAIPGHEDKEFARRVRKGTGADPGASGATRIARQPQFQSQVRAEFSARGDPHGTARPESDSRRTGAARACRSQGAFRAAPPCPL